MYLTYFFYYIFIYTVLYLFIGVQITNTGLLINIYEHIFPCLLQLASDADSVVAQLFDPLMIQITHWFSSQWKIRSIETTLLIDNLMVSSFNCINQCLIYIPLLPN